VPPVRRVVLAICAGDLSNNPAASAVQAALMAAAPAERAKGLKEYSEPARDIDDALKKAAAPSR